MEEDSQLSQDSTTLSGNTATSSITTSLSKKRQRRPPKPRDDLLRTINEKLHQPIQSARKKDRFDIFGDNVAVKLRALPDNQRIMNEKLINDVLFEAESNSLFRGWQLTPPSNFNNQHQRSATVYLELQPLRSIYAELSASQLFSTFNDTAY
ncbi:unnamed protein product [Psylliodes chrysocephalus]|uniref:Uncharacterized protein n=1 Tax=Psylliodes chrysocephalus TaxID=3402493 RepID=A0A9P0D105_9CUCU|nr:unnamed protein product [Psylliodes chrysocephala]